MEYPLHTGSCIDNGYFTELRRRYKDNTAKVMERASFAGISRIKPDPNSTEPFEINCGEIFRTVLRTIRDRQLVSTCQVKLPDISIDLRREALRLHVARDTKILVKKSAETQPRAVHGALFGTNMNKARKTGSGPLRGSKVRTNDWATRAYEYLQEPWIASRKGPRSL
jgi:hypothetical protein